MEEEVEFWMEVGGCRCIVTEGEEWKARKEEKAQVKSGLWYKDARHKLVNKQVTTQSAWGACTMTES